MVKELQINGIKWISCSDINNACKYKILKEYNFHELDIEACLEDNQRARVDIYDDYIFMVLHFPKYDKIKKIYNLNEFNIFLGKKILISIQDYKGTRVNNIFSNYKELNFKDNISFKITSGFILYEIIQTMLEKQFKVIANITKDLKEIEEKVFGNSSGNIVKEIMIKKRNIVKLKHMLLPQSKVLLQIESSMNKLFKGEIEEYFEDLEDKLNQIILEIKVLEEYIESMEDAFKTIIDIKTNNIITFLTLFSSFFLPLTLITSFYGMNINLPFQDNNLIVYIMFIISILIMIMLIIYIIKKKI